MVPIILVLIIFVSILLFTKYITDTHIKNKLIEKGLVDENVKYLYDNRFEGSVPSSLKWGIMLTGVGLAILIGQLVPGEFREEITMSAIFLFAGLGLIIYYFIGKKLQDQNRENKSKK